MQESLIETRLGRGVDLLAALDLKPKSQEKLRNADEEITFCKVYAWRDNSVRLGWERQIKPAMISTCRLELE